MKQSTGSVSENRREMRFEKKKKSEMKKMKTNSYSVILDGNPFGSMSVLRSKLDTNECYLTDETKSEQKNYIRSSDRIEMGFF